MRKALLSTCVLVLLTSTVALAGDEPKKEISKEKQAQMEAMMKAATPGDAHKRLECMVGNWDAKITMWYEPGEPPTVSAGTSESKWMLGGRWVQESVTSNFMGMPFSGLGYTGYDNVKKQYVGSWMDNFSTSMMLSTGNADEGGKSWTFSSSMDDPMSGKSMPVTTKVIVADNDHHTMEMWGPGPDGKPTKLMEIAYSRKK